MQQVVEALRQLCEWGAGQDGETAHGFQRILECVDWTGPRRDLPPPSDLPVIGEWLETAAKLCGDNPLGDLGRAVLAERAQLHWFTMYADYAGNAEIDTLRSGYAVLRITGPAAAWFADDLTTAVTLQAPNLHYPPHAHKQREIYGVIGGEADWQRGAEPWIRRQPGEVFFHPSGVRHATRTFDQPLLAFASWLDDVHLKPVFVTG